MNKYIYVTIFILFFFLQSILAYNRTLQLTSSETNVTAPVWVGDHIIIEAIDITARRWLFNNSILTEYTSGSWQPIESNISLLINATASDDRSNSLLTLHRIDRFYTGIYIAEENRGNYSLFMIVHEANVSSAEFVLYNTSNSCKAYLFITDFVDPSNFEVNRTMNSSDLTFTLADPLNVTSFEIIDSHLNVTDNSTNTDISIQYTFTYNNFSIVKPKRIHLDVSLIKQPYLETVGSPDNCTILIQHNTDVECVRNITYCLNTNDMESECNISSNLDDWMVEYPWNSTSTNLSIVYDIIYAKYRFDIEITQCITEAATSIEPSTMNSSPPEITTAQSGTSDITTSEGMTKHSDRIYSSMFSSLFSTYLDTVTIPSITASSELPNTTLSPTINGTGPSNDPESLAAWIIALIVVGSVICVVLLGGGIGFFLWKAKSMKTFGNESFRTTKIKPTEADIPMEIRPSSDEHVFRKSIPQPEPTNRLQVQHDRRRPSPPRTQSTSPERTDRQQRRLERRQPQSSNYDQTIRPTIPQPASKSYDPSSRQEARRQRRQVSPPNYEQYPRSSVSRSISTSPDPIHQQQIPNGRRRPLPPIPND